MKKLFSLLAIAALVSCNSGGDEAAAPAVDTAAVVAPAPEATPAVVDTTAKVDTAAAAK